MKLLPVLATLFLLNIANAQMKVPGQIIGNWINDKTNNWEYGFFEAFAVYENDFWEYEDIAVRNNKIWITLRKGARLESLSLNTGKDSQSLTIKQTAGKNVSYRRQDASAIPYTTPDHKPFKNSGFKTDTVTIIGYYRNLDQYLESARGERQKGPFSVSVPEFIQDDEVRYYSAFDSLGRFRIKFPVLNTQQVFVDWGRLTHLDVVEPGETIFIFADMADYIQKEDLREDWIMFRNKPKRIRFMGDEARIHNELAAYKPSALHFSPHEPATSKLPDLEFLKAARSAYDTRVHHLEQYINIHPTISRRFSVFQRAIEKYQLLSGLMQHRFEKRTKGVVFDDGYMQMVTSMMDLSDETLFTLVRDFGTFIRDYIGYHQDIGTLYKDDASGALRQRGMSVSDIDVLKRRKNNRMFSKQDAEIISRYVQMMEDMQPQLAGVRDTAKFAEVMIHSKKILSDVEEMTTRLGIRDSLPVWRTQLLQESRRASEMKQIDSLIPNETLQQLLIARILAGTMERNLLPLSQEDLKLLTERVTVQPIRDYIMVTNNRYLALGSKKLAYMSSLKNTDHLREAKDAEVLFKELISPYRGKVIYVDFWGTWCGPCREQMRYVGGLKMELQDEDVIFMYLANKSPERSWINYIKQMNLTGANVVHYRLPDAQQAMIERKFSVNAFPSYLLFDREGNMVLRNAPRPEARSELITAIEKLLDN